MNAPAPRHVVLGFCCGVALLLAAASGLAQTPPPVLPLLSMTDGTLFPGMSEEFQILAPWSRAMVEEVLTGDHIVGLVIVRPGSVPNAEGWHPIFPVGTLCVIDGVTRMPDGRMFIVLRGVMKFRVQSEATRRAYRTGRVDYLPEVVDEGAREPLRRLRLRLDELARAVEPVVLPEMTDAERVNALAYYRDLDLFERQTLLERDGVLARAQGLVDLLTMRLATGR